MNLTGLSVEALMGKSCLLRSMVNEYKAYDLTPPEEITEELAEIARRISDLSKDQIAADIKRAEARLEQLATAEEKRAKLKADIESLKAKLTK